MNKNKAITHKFGKDILIKSKDKLITNTVKNMTIKAQSDVLLQAEKTMQFQSNKDINFQSEANTTISGTQINFSGGNDGGIQLGGPGFGIEVKDGNVTFTGAQINFNCGVINVPTSPAPAVPVPTPAPQKVPELTAPKAQQKKQDDEKNKSKDGGQDSGQGSSGDNDSNGNDNKDSTKNNNKDTKTDSNSKQSQKKSKKIMYLVDSPDNPLSLQTEVNSLQQQELTINSPYEYVLQQPQETGPLDLFFEGKRFRVLDDISSLKFNDQNKAAVYIGQRSVKPEDCPSTPNYMDTLCTPKSQSEAINDDGNNLVMLQATYKSPTIVAPGSYQVETAPEEVIRWVLEQIGQVDVSISIGAKDLVTLVTSKNNRRFLSDFMKEGKFHVKELEGKRYVIFGGRPGLRKWVRGARYDIDNPKVKVINTLAKSAEGDVAGVAEDVAKGSPLGIVVIGAIDIVKYYTDPDKHKEFSDLIVDILGDVVNYFVATALGIAIVAGLVALLGLVTAATFPLAVLVIGTIVITAGIGWGLDYLENKSGLHDALIGIGRKCEDFLKKYAPPSYTESAVKSFFMMLPNELPG